MDILLNFFTGYEIDDSFKKTTRLELNLYKIVINYLKSWFIIDVIATFPFDYLFNEISVNNQLIKSIKLTRVFKLIRVVKLTKLWSFLNLN